MKKLITIGFLFFLQFVNSQVGINTTVPNAQLDIRSSNQATPSNTDGILIPKVDAFPATNPTAAQQGMLLYLTTTVGTDLPGFYYWDNATTDWKPIVGTNVGTLDQAYDFGGAGNGRTITADAGAVTINGTDGLVVTGVNGSGAIAPSGGGSKMVWNPNKAAFRAGRVTSNQWDDSNMGGYSVAFGDQTIASGSYSSAFGLLSVASGPNATAFGLGTSSASGNTFAAGFNTDANGYLSTVFGDTNVASSYGETVFGIGATTYTPSSGGIFNFRPANATDRLFVIGNAIDANSNGFVENSERSNAMVVLKNGKTGIGISTPQNLLHLHTSTEAQTFLQFTNATTGSTSTDGLVIGNIIATREAGIVNSEDANMYLESGNNGAQITVGKNGNIGIGAFTDVNLPLDKLHVQGNIRMVDGNQAAGRVLTSDANGRATWTDKSTVASGTLDQAYDFGGAGNGKTITADSGAVLINGTDGLVSTGTLGSGAILPSGAGIRMVWYPRKYAFRAGRVFGTEWDDSNVGSGSVALGAGTIASNVHSTALGQGTTASGFISTALGAGSTASGTQSTAFGTGTTASGSTSTAFGAFTIASALDSTAFGRNTIASGSNSTAFGEGTNALGSYSTAFGRLNTASSYAETVIGIGATTYTPSTNGETQFSTANATDRLFVIGNAIDVNNNGNLDTTERSDAMVVLKNGNIGIGNSTPLHKLDIKNNSTSTTVGQLYLEQEGTGDAIMHIGNTGARHFNLGLDISADSFKIGTSATTPTAVTTGTLMTIQATGEVGIGTATPTEKLHVSGPAGLTAVRVANTSTTGATSNVALDFFRNTGINTDWRIYNIGPNLTIGSSSDDLATVNDLYQFLGARFMPMNDGTQSLGQAANRWNTVFATNGTISTSDRREKKEIQPLTYGLQQLMQLQPVTFRWNNNQIDNNSKHLGFIAQDLQEVIPEVVVDSQWVGGEEGTPKTWQKAPLLGVNYAEVLPVLVKSIQEQQSIIEKQQKEIEQQKVLLESVLQRLEQLEKK